MRGSVAIHPSSLRGSGATEAISRRVRRLLGVLAVSALAVGPLPAQAPPPRPTPQDTLRRDTTDFTGLLLKAEEDTKVRLPTLPRVGLAALLPVRSRIILPRDSIDFLNAETVGDVLSEVAGVYLWRGGWLGRPELPNYLGRGATSVEYWLDGVPYVPMGQDSLAVDPSILPIGFVERIEIDQLPGLLRVHLFLRDHDLLAPWSRLNVARGQYDQGRYEGMLQRRTRSGIGFALGAAYWISPAFNPDGGDFDATYGWLEGSYVPSRRAGLRLRYRLTSPNRDPALTTGGTPPDTLTRPLDGGRSDLEARLTLRGSDDVLGRRSDLLVGRSWWKSDSLEQTLWRVGVSTGQRTATRDLRAELWYGSRWTTFDGRVHGGWTPSPLVSVAVEAAYQLHQESRTSVWGLARAGLDLPLGFEVAGSWRVGRIVARPSVPTDSAQSISDREIQVGWEHPRLAGSVKYTRLHTFQPVAFRQFTAVDTLVQVGETEWVTASARIAPRQWFTVQGWYSHPVRNLPDGMPPHHSMVTSAIQSKFLRTFPSGIFDLKLEVSIESWGTGVLGRDTAGVAVTLPGATMLRALIQMQFGGFIIYYDRYNLTDNRSAWVPPFRIPTQASTFGVRWSFHN